MRSYGRILQEKRQIHGTPWTRPAVIRKQHKVSIRKIHWASSFIRLRLSTFDFWNKQTIKYLLPNYGTLWTQKPWDPCSQFLITFFNCIGFYRIKIESISTEKTLEQGINNSEDSHLYSRYCENLKWIRITYKTTFPSLWFLNI